MSIWDDDVGMADYSALRPASGAWQDVGGARQRTEALYESMRDPDQKTGLAGIGQALEELNTTMNPEEEKDTQEQDVDALLEVLAASGATQEPDVSGGASQIESSASDRQPGMEEYSPGILRSMLDEVTPKDEESIAGGGPEYTDSSVGESAMQIGLHAAAAPETAVLMGDGVQKVRRALGNKTANSVTQMLKDAKKNPALKKQILKKIAMRGAMAFTGPVGWAILAADLGYNAAKYGSEAGWFGEGDPIGDFEDTVGGGLRGAWDWIKGDGEVGRNTKADGGRIHLNTGGILPWTQAMSSDYANQYYNQFSGPNYESIAPVSAIPTTGTTPTDPGNIPSNIGTPVGGEIIRGGGLAQQRGSGPEDRGTWEQRFSPEHQYNRPGVHQGVAYGFNDDGELVATHVPRNMTSMSVGDPAPAFLGGPLNMAAAGLGWLKDQIERRFIPEGVKEAFQKEEQQQESAMQEAARDLGGTVDPKAVEQALISSSASGGTGTKSYHTNQRLEAMKREQERFNQQNAAQGLAMTRPGDVYSTRSYSKKERKKNSERAGDGRGTGGGGRKDREAGRKAKDRKTGGGWCFHPDTLVQMADGSEQKINTIKIGDQTKGGEVTGVVQFKPLDEMHDYKGVIVAGSHFVKEDGRFIPVSESFEAVKVDIIPTVYSLDTTDRRIWIKDIEFADFNGDGIVKEFMYNAGFNLAGLQNEVLRQVEERLI